MKTVQQKCFVIVVMAFLFCATGLVVSETAFSAGGPQCVDNGDGTVTDNGTGLIWQKAKSGNMNWCDAISHASALSLGGYSDWQLPRYQDLKNLYKSECKNLMDVGYMGYWSSTETSRHEAGIVKLCDGVVFDDYKSSNYYVRAVRSRE